MGFCFQPKYRNKASGEEKTAAVWWISYSVRGQRHKESSGSTNSADAVRLLKQRIGEAQSGKPVGSQIERTTLADLLTMVRNDYLANARKTPNRITAAAPHLYNFFGEAAKARDITSDRVTSYQAARLEEGAKPANCNYEVSILRRGFHLAWRAGKVGVRPEFDLLHLDNARKGFFEAEQFRAVLKHLPEHLQALVRVAYITGWRRNELLSRQWRNVDFSGGWLRLEPGESKNGEGRQFPFTSELRAVLEQQREWVRELERRTEKIVPHVFPLPNGNRIGDFRKRWACACKAAGVPSRLLHDFRRTAVRNLERAGVPRSAAMRLTGHKTEAATAGMRSWIPRCCRKLLPGSKLCTRPSRTVQVRSKSGLFRRNANDRGSPKTPYFRHFFDVRSALVSREHRIGGPLAVDGREAVGERGRQQQRNELSAGRKDAVWGKGDNRAGAAAGGQIGLDSVRRRNRALQTEY
jgi:integrase